jgi:hypothetical protein
MESTAVLAKEENTTPSGSGGGGEVTAEQEQVDKTSMLALWYADNQKSPMYSLIRQKCFTAYEEGMALGESLVPLKSTLGRTTTTDNKNSDRNNNCSSALLDMTTVVCGTGADEAEETTTTTTPGDGSRGESSIPLKIGVEDFMGSSSSQKACDKDVVEVTLLREESDACDGVDDRDGIAVSVAAAPLDDKNDQKSPPAARVPVAAAEDKEDDHDDIEVLWKEQEETSDGGVSGGPDDLIKQVMDKFLVEVKVEEEWNEQLPALDAEDEQEQDDKYAVVHVAHQPGAERQEPESPKQQHPQEQLDETEVADEKVEDYIQNDGDDEEEQEDRYAVKANPSEIQPIAATLENDAATDLDETIGEKKENRQDNATINYNNIEDEEDEEKHSEKAVEEEVIFMSRDFSEDADKQQLQQDAANAENVAFIQAEEQPASSLESSELWPTDSEDEQAVVMFSSRDNSAAADEEVAAIIEPDPDAENKTGVKDEFEKNEGEQQKETTIHGKLQLRRPMETKTALSTQGAKDSKEKESESFIDGDLDTHKSPLQGSIEMLPPKAQVMTNQIQRTIRDAMEHRDVWYDMSLTSRDESITADQLSTSVIPNPLSPRTDSDMTISKNSSREEEDDNMSFNHYDGDSSNEGPFQIIIEGAGTPEVNGVYLQDGYYGGACRYSKKGHWKEGPCMFYICQCMVHDGTRSWFLSLVPDGCPVVTGYFYSASVTKACRHIPPLKGWGKAVHGQRPRPTLSYRSKLAEENIKLSAEKEATEQQNEALSLELTELKATFTQQQEAWSKEKETWEQQQKYYEDNLSKQRDQVEQSFKDIASLRATIVDYEDKEQKLKDEIVYLNSTVTVNELQLKLVLENQSLQLELAQYEQKDPEALKAQTQALREKVIQYKQQEQLKQQTTTINHAEDATASTTPPSSPPSKQVKPPSSPSIKHVNVQKEEIVAKEKAKSMICLPHPLI